MADAGVPASVIDVVVAVSYPDRFALSRNGDIERLQAEQEGRGGYGYGGGYGRRIPLYGYPTYGYGYGYGDPYFGYSPYGYGWGYYGAPSVIVVEPRDPEPQAKVVKGKGYSRGGNAPTGSSVSDGGSRRGGGNSGSSSSGSSGGSGSS